MLKRLASSLVTVLIAGACSAPVPQDEPAEDRDLTLAPVEQTTPMFNDRAQAQPARIGDAPRATIAPRIPLATLPENRETNPAADPELEAGEQPTEPATLAEPPAPPSLGGGYSLNLAILETIDTGEQGIGSPVAATLRSPVFNEHGDLVIPAGAVFRGTITEVSPYEGRVDLAFTRVEFNEAEYPVETVTASVTDEDDESDQPSDDLAIGGLGTGIAIVDTRGEGIGRSPDGPVVVISGGTGVTCDAPRDFFPFGGWTLRSFWARP